MHLQLVELENDLKRLKSIDPIADKVKLKRDDLLPKWLPLVDEYLAKVANGEPTYENPLFSHCIVWLFDIGDFDSGLRYGLRAIELGQPLPKNFKRRQFPTFIADKVFDWAEGEAELGNSIDPYFSDVFKKVTGEWKLHEAVTAKFYKLAGLQLLRDPVGEVKASAIGNIDTLQQADHLLEKASTLHKAAGVKTLRTRIAMRIRALEKFGSNTEEEKK